MTDDLEEPTSDEKQAAADVLANPDYVPEPIDARDDDTADDPIEEED